MCTGGKYWLVYIYSKRVLVYLCLQLESILCLYLQFESTHLFMLTAGEYLFFMFKVRSICLSMFTVGEYSFPQVSESHMKMYRKYGPIVHECLGNMHFVRLFDPQVRILKYSDSEPKPHLRQADRERKNIRTQNSGLCLPSSSGS